MIKFIAHSVVLSLTTAALSAICFGVQYLNACGPAWMMIQTGLDPRPSLGPGPIFAAFFLGLLVVFLTFMACCEIEESGKKRSG